MEVLIGFHIVISIVTYLSIYDKKKAGFTGVIFSVLPVINIIIFSIQMKDMMLRDILIIKKFKKDKAKHIKYVVQLASGELNYNSLKKQILYDLTKEGMSSIDDINKRKILFREIGSLTTTIYMEAEILKNENKSLNNTKLFLDTTLKTQVEELKQSWFHYTFFVPKSLKKELKEFGFE